MASFVNRVIGAAALRVSTYEEIEADKGATIPALVIVVLSSLAVGFAQAVDWFIAGAVTTGAMSGAASAIVAFIGYTILAVVGWLMWVIITLIVGTKMFPEPETSSNLGELTRTVGFAQVPGMFRIFSAIPILGYLVTFVVWLWMLAAFVVAARQALDYKSLGRAIAVCAIGWIINGIFVEWIGRFILAMVLAFLGAAIGG